jgi:hypothetical protein
MMHNILVIYGNNRQQFHFAALLAGFTSCGKKEYFHCNDYY